MQDIIQATSGTTVTFSANSTEADIWMRGVDGDQTITFALPDQLSEALAFRNAAAARDFSIGDL